MRYKKPKNFSQTENTVTMATVLKKYFNTQSAFNFHKSILFARAHKYNKRMEKIFYRAENGDSVLSVSERMNVSAVKLIADNRLTDEIQEGDMLYIECESGVKYTAEPWDTLDFVAKKFGTSGREISLKNGGVPYLFYGMTIII